MSRFSLQLANRPNDAGFFTRRFAAALFIALLTAGAASAVEVPERSALGEKEFLHPDLDIDAVLRLVGQLPVGRGAVLAGGDLTALGVPADRGWLDARGGRWAAITPSQPLLPGSGVGNELTWEDLGRSEPANDAAWRAAVAGEFRGYLESHAVMLRIDVSELAGGGRATVHEGGAVAQMYLPRVVQGLPVRGSYLTAVINHGNLVLFGAHNWGDVEVSATPKVLAAAALATVEAHVQPFIVSAAWGKHELIIVPMARGHEAGRLELGQGYAHRLAWVIRPSLVDDLGRWEALVDAHSGELLSFEDTNRYAEIAGGVYPVTNDGIAPDGVEQLGWPMPFQEVSTTSGTLTTDTGGNLPATGSMTATFFGPYVNINDNCGADSLTQNDNIDWGGSSGTDCVTPGFGGAGNTHASRTGFYELNRIIELGRSHLPSNTWLQNRLTSNMNINNTCNAFWGGGTVNFYRSGGGCFNTGEIAGVFDHEWGHGLDDNDAVPTIASPSGEGIADIYAALRLDTSCIGRNFRSTVCTGFGDPCLTCTGVRDIDYLKRASGNPHTYTWSNANCGGSVHCVGAVYAEAVWSLWKRKLQSAPYNYDNNTANEIVNRLTYIGAGNTGTWFSGGPPNGGCAGSSGYMNYLAADDDNGDLNDGTPHMQAIFDAFDDQEIACGTPTVQDAGCAGVPTVAPVVSTTAGNQQIDLSWGAVSGATSYDVFRTEGVFLCDFGKVKIGSTAGTSFNDSGLKNGRDYSYVVVPKSSAACFGPASACATDTPAAGPDLSIDTSSTSLAFTSGDSDVYLDNCESATVTFDVINTGLGSLTNVRIVGVTPSNAGVTITTSFPTAISPSTLAEGATGSGSFSLIAGGLVAGETLTLQVEVTADELAASKVGDLVVSSTETDLTLVSSLTYSFESDAEGWTTVQGTFVRSSSGGGAGGTTWYEQSSANLNDQCDQIQSPVVVLGATTTLTLSNQFDIEPFFAPGGVWYDRANVGVVEVATAGRTPVNPDGGRLYNASGANGNCGTNGQDGWADAATTWAASSWSAAALGSPGLAGQEVQLDIRYGTDFSLNGFGFRFDEVTLTDVSVPGPDGQTDICGGCTVNADCDDGTFCNGAEICDATSGICQPGTPPACDDGAFCNGTETCNETTDSCDPGTPPACDDGAFCNGTETCNEATDSCDPGTPPACDDGAFCNGTESCNEGTDSCDPGTPPACDDGAFCNGAETCNEGTDSCDPGTPPACGDGVGCTVDACNEGTDSCDNIPDDGLCDNGQFCDGAEACDAILDCQAGSDPCPGQACDEVGDICLPLCSSTLALPDGVPGGSGWEQISMPCDPGPADTVADVVGDDLAGVYGTDWIMYRRDEATGSYVTLTLGDSLVVGEGYWIKTLLAGQSVSMGADVSALADIPLTGVSAPPPAGCAGSAGQCNIVGNPHNFDVCWADVLVDDGGVLKDLATVDPSGACQTTGTGCIMSRIGQKWTGSSYAPFDGTTPGMEGTLVPWDGFWVSANKPGIELRIPATPGSCGPPAATDTRGGGPNGWYGRLIVESGTLEDRANVFGELSDSVGGYDSHDLQELPPFGDGFLTLVFPHAEWGGQAGDYSSDFRELGASRTQSWSFRVRSSDEQADVVLRWEVPPSQLERSTLIDLGSDEEIAPASDGSYAFTMEGPRRDFAWVVR